MADSYTGTGSTGMLLTGKSHVFLNGTVLEHIGEMNLPETKTNDEQEVVSDLATRNEIIKKGGFENITIPALFDPQKYKYCLDLKNSASICTIQFNMFASDGGTFDPEFTCIPMRVGGPSAAPDDVFQTFDFELKVISYNDSSFSGSLGNQVYNN